VKKWALYQGTASAVPIGRHFPGISPWFGNPAQIHFHPPEKTGAKGQYCSLNRCSK
jgi:hypothetical protein